MLITINIMLIIINIMLIIINTMLIIITLCCVAQNHLTTLEKSKYDALHLVYCLLNLAAPRILDTILDILDTNII